MDPPIRYDDRDPDLERRWLALAFLVEQAGLGRNPWFVDAMRRMSRGPQGDRKVEAEIVAQLRRYHQIRQFEKSLYLFGASPDHGRGDIYLGQVAQVVGDRLQITQQPLRIPLSAFFVHGILTSKSGSGKSFALRQISREVAPHATVCFIEFAKRETGYLKELFDEAGQPLEMVSWHEGSLGLNPFIVPPGSSPTTWTLDWSEIFQAATNCPEGATDLLEQVMIDHYTERGVYEGSRNYGSILDIIERVKAVRGATYYQSREALLKRLQGLVRVLGRDTLTRHIPLAQLERTHHAINLDGLDKRTKDVVSLTLTAGILRYRIERPTARRLLLVLEEAGGIVTRCNPKFLDNLERVRALNMSLLMATQEVRIHETVLNACSLFMLGMLHPNQIRMVASAFSLTPDQTNWFAQNRKPRLFILSTDALNYKPVLFESAELKLKTGVNLPETIHEEETDTPLATATAPSAPAPATTPSSAEPTQITPALPFADVSYLETIAGNPHESSTRFDKLVVIDGHAGVSRSRGQATRERLLRNGYVTAHDVPAGRNIYTILRLTRKGLDVLTSDLRERYLSECPPPEQDQPGPLHEHLKWRIARAARAKGFRVEPERPTPLRDGGSMILDLYLESHDRDRKIGVEIQVTHVRERLPEKVEMLSKAHGLTERYLIVPNHVLSGAGPKPGSPDVKVMTLATFLNLFK